jgi:HTH-type transcriptional regulator/antitoxin HigA
MEALKYTVIKNRKQYDVYCSELEQLVMTKNPSRVVKEETALLTVLIEKWDSDHNTLAELDPVELLQELMEQKGMNATTLATKLGKSKGLISDILNYKKAFSKEMIRDLGAEFKISQDAFNRVYPLKSVPSADVVTVPLKGKSPANMPKEMFMPAKKYLIRSKPARKMVKGY